jgi:hypothetical protein
MDALCVCVHLSLVRRCAHIASLIDEVLVFQLSLQHTFACMTFQV